MASAERALVEENRRLRSHNARLVRENQDLRNRISELEARLENSRRTGKRQAAPFSKGAPTPAPKRPGRRRGAAHGRHGHRRAPAHVDEVLDAPLPACCPHCDGALEEHRVEPQYHTELPPVRPHITRFDVHVGQCQRCQRRIGPRWFYFARLTFAAVKEHGRPYDTSPKRIETAPVQPVAFVLLITDLVESGFRPDSSRLVRPDRRSPNFFSDQPTDEQRLVA